MLRSGTPTAHERVALPLLPSGPGGVRRFSLRGAQPSTPPREAHSTRSALEREFNPAEADCGLQGTANSPSSTAKLKTSGGGAGIRTRGTGVTHARHFQCRTFGRSVTPPRLLDITRCFDSRKLAEGRGFEPPRDLLGPYPISSRTPSTGLGHPSAQVLSPTYLVSHLLPTGRGRRRVEVLPKFHASGGLRCSVAPCSRSSSRLAPGPFASLPQRLRAGKQR